MKAVYENHYLTDMDVANFGRHSFEKLAENFSTEANHNLIRFLARGMTSGDWDLLIEKMLHVPTKQAAKELATYLRKIPEHWVPFAHPHITLRMHAPVPIRTQCFKHKQGLVESEVSRRYISSRPVLYVPEYFRAKPEGSVKQGSAGKHIRSDYWRNRYIHECEKAILTYEEMVADGICPEQSRFHLPQGVEVHWVWTGSLYAFVNFYNQRADSHAQKEIQELAEQVSNIIEPLFPVSWNALTKGDY